MNTAEPIGGIKVVERVEINRRKKAQSGQRGEIRFRMLVPWIGKHRESALLRGSRQSKAKQKSHSGGEIKKETECAFNVVGKQYDDIVFEYALCGSKYHCYYRQDSQDIMGRVWIFPRQVE
ncbi:hypothetical protein AB2N04_18755 [Nitratireductor sp. GISD-1A_MAKvit]|uniref:hypothetical protein n=1 Tax=Nitratireductor sp. GISD-1A_MAKvit TaxID=3234198 RepID=UPI003465148C